MSNSTKSTLNGKDPFARKATRITKNPDQSGPRIIKRLQQENRQLRRKLSRSIVLNIALSVIVIAVSFSAIVKCHNLKQKIDDLNEPNVTGSYATIDNLTNAFGYRTLGVNTETKETPTVEPETNTPEVHQEPTETCNTETTLPEKFTDDAQEIAMTEEQQEPTTIRDNSTGLPEKYADIPLDYKLKAYIYKSAVDNGIPAEILFSMMWKESTFNPNAKSSTDDHGLFQINRCNFKYLANIFGYPYESMSEIVYDPYANTDFAIAMIIEARDNYYNDNWHHVLMRYNMGPSTTSDLFAQGIYSTSYSRTILNYALSSFGFTEIELD